MKDISINIINAFLDGASRLGIDSSVLLESAGLGPEMLVDFDCRISFHAYMEMWHEASSLSDDPHLGLHLAEATPVERFGLVAKLAVASANLGDAIARYLRYRELLNAAMAERVEVADGLVRVVFALERAPWILIRHYAEYATATVWLAIRRMLGPDTRPAEVAFQHARPLNIDEHLRVFAAPIAFSEPQTALVFHAALLERPFASADSSLLNAYEDKARALLQIIPVDDPFTKTVQRVIFDSLPAGDIALKSIARKLDVSPGVLRRRLVERRTSYQGLLTALRRELALVYVQEKDWSVADVAFALGFSDSSAFKRTFKRWTGKSPGEYRKALYGD